jgi:hypothetical protein
MFGLVEVESRSGDRKTGRVRSALRSSAMSLGSPSSCAALAKMAGCGDFLNAGFYHIK